MTLDYGPSGALVHRRVDGKDVFCVGEYATVTASSCATAGPTHCTSAAAVKSVEAASYNAARTVGEQESELGYASSLRLGRVDGSGRYLDALLHLRARAYDPETRVFLQADSVDAQRYAYTGGDPVNRSDPTGMMWDGSDGPMMLFEGMEVYGSNQSSVPMVFASDAQWLARNSSNPANRDALIAQFGYVTAMALIDQAGGRLPAGANLRSEGWLQVTALQADVNGVSAVAYMSAGYNLVAYSTGDVDFLGVDGTEFFIAVDGSRPLWAQDVLDSLSRKLDYIDINFTWGRGLGFTGGIILSVEGPSRLYAGFGLAYGGSATVTYSSSAPAQGWNVAISGTVHGGAGQVGIDPNGNFFAEIGLARGMSASAMAFYIFPPFSAPINDAPISGVP